MILRRLFRYVLYFLSAVVTLIVVFFLIGVAPIDRDSYKEKPFYPKMLSHLDSLSTTTPELPTGTLHAGYAVVNLTPAFPVSTAGYGKRRGKEYTAVHDSIFVRSVVLDNGKNKVAIVSADLLIIPPAVTAILPEKLQRIGFSLDNVYLNATHTHNSIGNWGERITTLIYGSYKDTVVNFIAERIALSIQEAASDLKQVSMRYGEFSVASAVRHRIAGSNGHVDDKLRAIELTRTDSSRMVMVSYNAHPTCLYARDLELSRDYPGVLVDRLEREGYDFAMFLSGAVGSHGCNPPEYGKPCLNWMSDEIYSGFQEVRIAMQPVRDSTLAMVRIPLELGDPQFKISQNWRLRSWVFRALLGESKPNLTALRVGNVLMLGTPCDYSGELREPIDSVVSLHGGHAIITSFNGHYIGYITADQYFDSAHYETRLMNWYGPGNGQYVTDCLVSLAETMSK